MNTGAALAAIRFGYGLSPAIAPPTGPADILDRLSGPDHMAQRYPMPSFAEQADHARALNRANGARRKALNTSDEDRTKKAYQQLQRQTRQRATEYMARTVARSLDAQDGFRERLTRFWADHFTVIARRAQVRGAGVIYVDDTIRPNLTGRFADMLRAATLHPYMLIYLDQTNSVGPNSAFAQNNAQKAVGLNENLARELLELHTLGVGGGYGQTDVRQLAELLAGLSAKATDPAAFQPRRGEPGPETVLGRSYGRQRPDLQAIEQVIADLAVHPDTARHIARKLAVHFVSDQPDPSLVDHVAARFRDTDGDLMAVYAALLEHPSAWAPDLGKVKQPFDFVTSSLRALGMRGDWLTSLDNRVLVQRLRGPVARMGQPWEAPTGPDGWPEDAAHWITPQGMATRITWAMRLGRLDGIEVPDPRAFVETALGPMASPRTRFAAEAAESREDGVGVVLASPDFQRR